MAEKRGYITKDMQPFKAAKGPGAKLCALVLAGFLPITGCAGEDDWLGQDKFLHFGASALIDSACYWTLREGIELPKYNSLAISAAATLSLGVAKELSDETFSGKDLAWDIIGTGVGTILWVIIDRRNDRLTATVSSSFAGVEYLRRF